MTGWQARPTCTGGPSHSNSSSSSSSSSHNDHLNQVVTTLARLTLSHENSLSELHSALSVDLYIEDAELKASLSSIRAAYMEGLATDLGAHKEKNRNKDKEKAENRDKDKAKSTRVKDKEKDVEMDQKRGDGSSGPSLRCSCHAAILVALSNHISHNQAQYNAAMKLTGLQVDLGLVRLKPQHSHPLSDRPWKWTLLCALNSPGQVLQSFWTSLLEQQPRDLPFTIVQPRPGLCGPLPRHLADIAGLGGQKGAKGGGKGTAASHKRSADSQLSNSAQEID